MGSSSQPPERTQNWINVWGKVTIVPIEAKGWLQAVEAACFATQTDRIVNLPTSPALLGFSALKNFLDKI
jgi:hypothetical protein